MTARYIVGDACAVLATLPDDSVDLVLTSPPFLGLRSYLPDDDENKADEVGSGVSPGEYVDSLLDVVEACARVIAPHGSLVFELGDTYAGSNRAGGSSQKSRGRNAKSDENEKPPRADGEWPAPKSLCLIPESFRWALVYGRSPFTGRRTPQWRARNVVRWCRPNPPVGALGDKFRNGTSDLVIACKGARRYFDLDAVRQPLRRPSHEGSARRDHPDARRQGANLPPAAGSFSNAIGAPPFDWWRVPTAPYRGAHYATWPPALLVRPIKTMCPERVCTVCGEPSRRIVEKSEAYEEYRAERNAEYAARDLSRVGRRLAAGSPGAWDGSAPPPRVDATTVGWTDCGHDAWRRGVVLDPFAGTGTTLAVAERLERDSIGVDLDERNVRLARRRVGDALAVETVPA